MNSLTATFDKQFFGRIKNAECDETQISHKEKSGACIAPGTQALNKGKHLFARQAGFRQGGVEVFFAAITQRHQHHAGQPFFTQAEG